MRLFYNFQFDLRSVIIGSLGTLAFFFLTTSVIGSSNRIEKCISGMPKINDTQLESKIKLLKQDICENIIITFENQHNIWRFVNYGIVILGFGAIAWSLFASNEEESIKNSKIYILYFAIFMYSLKSFMPFEKYEVASALLAGEGRKIVAELNFSVKDEKDLISVVKKYQNLYDIAIKQWQDNINNSNKIDEVIKKIEP